MKTRVRPVIIGLLIIAALGVWQVFTGDTAIRQYFNMKKADAHLPIVRRQLDAFPEFRHLTVARYTGAGGSLVIDGPVASEVDANRVKQIVEETKPPVPVLYLIFQPTDAK